MPAKPVPRVSPEELDRRLRSGERLVVLDVRGRSWQTSDRQVPGAVRIPPRELEAQVDRLPPGAAVVAYCT